MNIGKFYYLYLYIMSRLTVCVGHDMIDIFTQTTAKLIIPPAEEIKAKPVSSTK